MAKKVTKRTRILSKDVEDEIRDIVRDEMKKSTKSEAAKLMTSINEKISSLIRDHFLELSNYTIKIFKDKEGK